MVKPTFDKLEGEVFLHTHELEDINGLTNPLLFKGTIDVPGDFPTSSEVQTGWLYKITTSVIDNDPSKTNTGQAFSEGDEIAWNGTDWSILGNENLDLQDVTDNGNTTTNDVEANSFIKTSATSDDVLLGDGTTTSLSGISTSPAGNNTEIQFNDAGSFGASSNLTYDSTNRSLLLESLVTDEAASFLVDYTLSAVPGLPFLGTFNYKFGINDSGNIFLGPDTVATGARSLAAGLRASATGDDSIAIGSDTVSNNSNTLAIGSGSQAIGSLGVAVGRDCVAPSASFAFGLDSKGTTNATTAIGIGALSAHSNATSIASARNAGASDANKLSTRREDSVIIGVKDGLDESFIELSLTSGLTSNGGRVRNTTRVTTTYTILTSDDVVFANTNSAGFTVTLPAGVEGQTFKIINSGTSGNTLSVAPDGSELLLGANSSFSLNDGETLILTYNATDGWM